MSFDERLILGGMIFIYLSFFTLYIKILYKTQKKLNFIHSGWIMGILVFLYGIVIPIDILFSERIKYNNVDFMLNYSFDSLVFVFLMFILTIISFIFAEFIILYLQKNYKKHLTTFIGKEKKISKFSFLIVFLIVFLLILFVFNHNLSAFNSFIEMITMNRSTRYQMISETSGQLPVLPIVHTLFLFLMYYSLSQRSILVQRLTLFLFLCYSIYLLVSGSRLGIVVLLLGFLFLNFLFNKDWIYRNILKIILFIAILVILFLLLQTGRTIFTYYILTGEVDFGYIKFTDASNSEFVTGYIAGMMLNNMENIRHDYFSAIKALSFLPTALFDLFHLEKAVPYSNQMANFQFTREGNAVFTTTYPVDLYYSSGFFFLILYTIIIYILIFYVLYFFTKGKGISVMIAANIFMNLFFLIRLEISNSVGKLARDLFFMLLIIFIIKLFNKVFYWQKSKNKIRKR